MEAVRDAGNSLRRTLVSWRWLGVGFNSSETEDEDSSGVREIDQASPLRKRTLDAAATLLDVPPDEMNPADAFDERAEILFPDSRRGGNEASSHCVLHSCLANASLATMPRRMLRLVLIPSTYVSARARFAFRTTSSQLGAVMMILAIRLSKSVPMTAGCEGRR